ncbi:SLC13 family permease [uncultured Agathobaculum sp.]|uniref:SLC13 family permease n=1 Tax=uncultured Agathobaculum sp. TaxID=2048140 RepID=UPI00320A8109
MHPFLTKVGGFVRREAVLVISLVCALLSMLAVPPDAAYADYIDLRVLCLLFCLMAVVAGLQQCGLFTVLAQCLLTGRKQLRLLYLALVLLPFFCSMLITNDVTLITFVPFTVLVLSHIDRMDALIRVVVLQTLAANLGSMATPVGNPQNLFLCSYYGLGFGAFLRVVLPLTLVSLLALSAAALWTRGETIEITLPQREQIRQPRLFVLLCLLFVLCLLSVVHVLHYGITTAAVALCLLLFARGLFARVDYALLLTFVGFFIFAGNIGRIEAVRNVLELLLGGSAYWTSVLASQVISNVPAAVLLSGFTDNWSALLAGVDVGGLGTPIASLASLISLKLYLRAENASLPRYLLVFTLANIAGLVLLSAAAFLFGCVG